MATPVQITIESLERFNESIKQTLDEKRITDTGRAKNSIRLIVRSDGVASVGVDYLEILNTGRGPGNFLPVQNIREWVQSKLNVEEKDINSVAYLVGRKIATEGTLIFKDNSLGIELEKKIDELRKELIKILPEAFKAEIIQKLNKFANERLNKT